MLRKKNKVGAVMLPDIKLHYKARVIKQQGTCIKRDTQINGTEQRPEINPCHYGQLIFNKGSKNIQLCIDSLVNKWCWENWTGTYKKMKLDDLFTPYRRINSKWIKDLNVKLEIIKILEGNIGSKISDILHHNIFSDITPQAKETSKQMGLHQTKNVLHSKGNHQQNKRQFIE